MATSRGPQSKPVNTERPRPLLNTRALNTLRPEALKRGFQVVLVDVKTGTSEPFLHNKQPGPAGATPGSGGLERPVDCKFHPNGRSLYVLDFGSVSIKRNTMLSYAHTGVLWRVTRD